MNYYSTMIDFLTNLSRMPYFCLYFYFQNKDPPETAEIHSVENSSNTYLRCDADSNPPAKYWWKYSTSAQAKIVKNGKFCFKINFTDLLLDHRLDNLYISIIISVFVLTTCKHVHAVNSLLIPCFCTVKMKFRGKHVFLFLPKPLTVGSR